MYDRKTGTLFVNGFYNRPNNFAVKTPGGCFTSRLSQLGYVCHLLDTNMKRIYSNIQIRFFK